MTADLLPRVLRTVSLTPRSIFHISREASSTFPPSGRAMLLFGYHAITPNPPLPPLAPSHTLETRAKLPIISQLRYTLSVPCSSLVECPGHTWTYNTFRVSYRQKQSRPPHTSSQERGGSAFCATMTRHHAVLLLLLLPLLLCIPSERVALLSQVRKKPSRRRPPCRPAA